MKLSDDAARFVEALSRGERAEASNDTVNSLVLAGVVQGSRGWSRRSVVKGGAVAVGAGSSELVSQALSSRRNLLRNSGLLPIWRDGQPVGPGGATLLVMVPDER